MKSYTVKLFLLIASTFMTSFVAAENYKSWRVIDNNGGSRFEFSMVIDESAKGTELNFSSEADQLKPSGNNILLKTLFEYFSAARNNNIKKIKALYFIDDGSRERFQKEIKNNPGKFSKFHVLKKVVIDEIVNWGGYRAINIRLYGEKGLLTPFTELLYCSGDSCKLSNRIIAQNDAFSFFTTLMGLVPKSKEIDIRKDKGAPVLPDSSVDQFPIYANLKLNRFSPGASVKRDVKSDLSKLDISEHHRIVTEFIHSVWKIDSNNNYQLDVSELSEGTKNKPEDIIYSNEIINKAFLSSWDKSYSQVLIPNYKIEEAEATINTKKNDTVIGTTNYTDLAISQLIAKWKQYDFKAFLETDKSIYIWMQYELVDEKSGLFLFSIDKKTKKLTSQTGMLGIIMTNKLFVGVVNKSLKSHDNQGKGK